MNKLFFLLLLVSSLACNAQSTGKIVFDIRYKPSTEYSQNIEQVSETTVKYSGSQEMMDMLADNGMENPKITGNSSVMKSVLLTEKQDADGNFPLTITMLNTVSSDGKIVIPDNTKFYGRGMAGKMPMLDSIVSKEMDSEVKKMLLGMMQNIFSQTSFPEKKVAVGESFTVDTPLTIPIAGHTFDMAIKTKYTLLNIKNGIAELDIVQDYVMKTEIMDQKLNADGGGKGKMFYDIQNNFYQKYQMDTNMQMSVPMEKFDFTVVSKSGMTQTVSIKAKG